MRVAEAIGRAEGTERSMEEREGALEVERSRTIAALKQVFDDACALHLIDATLLSFALHTLFARGVVFSLRLKRRP